MGPVDICNEALRQLGANRITSLDDDSTEAKVMKDIFASTRDELMAGHWWTFAVTRLTLAADVDVPDFEYEHQFTLPSTVLTVLRCDDGSGDFDLEWQREGDKVVANLSGPLYAQVIQRVEDASLWSPGFCKALAYQLAADACISINENASQYERLLKIAQFKTRQALAADGRQGRAEVVRGSGLWKVR